MPRRDHSLSPIRAVQGISSQGQFFQNSLANTTPSPSGSIVAQFSGLPTAFYEPGLGLTNNVYRQHLYDVGLTDTIAPNSYSLFGFYSQRQSLTPPVTAPAKTRGVNVGYDHDIRPDLSGYASIGYVNSINSPTVVNSVSPIPVLLTNSNFNMVSGSVGLNYVLGRTPIGSIVYTLMYQTNGSSFGSGRTGDVVVNQLQPPLSKTF
jgi:hypothetical protein